jgi:hypothetical protein
MAPFGSRKDESPIRVQVLTVDYVVDGLVRFSGQNFVRLIHLTDATMRSTSGGAAPEPRGTGWAVGERMDGVVGVAAQDGEGTEKLLDYGNAGKHELAADIYTGPYRVRGTLLAPDGDPEMLANLAPVVMRDVQIDSLAGGSGWSASAVLLYMTQLQGIVLAG